MPEGRSGCRASRAVHGEDLAGHKLRTLGKQKNYRLVYHILECFFTQPAAIYRGL